MNADPAASNRIEFRLNTLDDSLGSIDAFIDGVNLVTLWEAVADTVWGPPSPAEIEVLKDLGPTVGGDKENSTQSVLTSREDLAMWGPEGRGSIPSSWEFDEIPSGYIPVLLCSCGNFLDGGVYARITFHEDTVVWEDFHLALDREAAPLGPFVFDRQQYEDARRAFSRS